MRRAKIAQSILRVFSLLILGLLFLLVIRGLSTLGVREVVCKSQYGACPSSVSEKLSFLKGKNLILTSENEVKQQTVKEISRIKLSKKLPDTLILDITLKKARVAVATSGQTGWQLVDFQGVSLGETQKTSLPKLVISQSVTEEEFVFAVQVLSYLSTIYRDLEGRINAGFFINTGTTEVVLPPSGSSQVVAGTLHFVMSRVTIENKNPVKIDLRFKNPVVEF